MKMLLKRPKMTNMLGRLLAIILMCLPMVSHSKISCYSKTGTVSCSGCTGCNESCLGTISCGAWDGPCGCSGSAYRNIENPGEKIVKLGFQKRLVKDQKPLVIPRSVGVPKQDPVATKICNNASPKCSAGCNHTTFHGCATNCGTSFCYEPK